MYCAMRICDAMCVDMIVVWTAPASSLFLSLLLQVGSLSDIWLFGLIKKATKGKLLWLRATGSTVISQTLDSFVVSYVAFSLGKSLTGQTPATLEEVIKPLLVSVTSFFLIKI